MTYVQRLLNSSLRHAGLLLVLGILTLGLTGCYTQLQVADTEAHRPHKKQTHAKKADRAPSYADEYRREYRRKKTHKKAHSRTQETVTYQYNYYFEDDYWGHSRWHYDPFFHDAWGFYHAPWHYDPWYGPRFSFSISFGTPYYRSWRYRPWYAYGYGPRFYRPYHHGNYYFGDHYYFYDDSDVRPNRNYTPRGATIGRGASTAGRRATDRSVTRSAPGTNARAHTGRIGRTRDEARTARIGRTDRADRSRTSTRIGRSSGDRGDRTRVRRTPRQRSDGTTRARSGRTEPRERSARTRSGKRAERGSSSRGGSKGRSRGRGGSDDDNGRRLRSEARPAPSPSSGRIGRRPDARVLTRSMQEALPTRIRVPDYENLRNRLQQKQRERRTFQFRSNPRFDRSDNDRRTRSRRAQPDRNRAAPSRSSSPDRRARSGGNDSSSRSDDGGRSRSRSRDDNGR